MERSRVHVLCGESVCAHTGWPARCVSIDVPLTCTWLAHTRHRTRRRVSIATQRIQYVACACACVMLTRRANSNGHRCRTAPISVWTVLASIAALVYISGMTLWAHMFITGGCSFVRSITMDSWSDDQLSRMMVTFFACFSQRPTSSFEGCANSCKGNKRSNHIFLMRQINQRCYRFSKRNRG